MLNSQRPVVMDPCVRRGDADFAAPIKRLLYRLYLSNSGCAFARMTSRSRRIICARFANKLPALDNRGRREDRVRAAPAVSCAICASKSAHEHTGPAGASRPSLRSGFTACFVLSPVNGSIATVVGGISPAQLSASTAAPGPHDFAVRSSTVRQRRLHVHRISPHVRDDRDPPLNRVRRAELCR